MGYSETRELAKRRPQRSVAFLRTLDILSILVFGVACALCVRYMQNAIGYSILFIIALAIVFFRRNLHKELKSRK